MASGKQLNLGQTQILIGKEVVVGTSHECSIFSHELQKSQRLARVWGEAHNVQKSLDYCWRLICQQFLFMTPSYYMASCYDFFVIVAQCQSLSHVRFFATPRTVDLQAPLSMEFSSQEYQSGLPFPSPGDLPNSGTEPGLLHCRQILYPLSHLGCVNKMRYFKLPALQLNVILLCCSGVVRRHNQEDRTAPDNI